MDSTHTKLLVVDDDPALRQLLADYLNRHGYDTLLAPDASDLPARIARYSPDLLVLDRMLPGGDGADACRRLREQGEDIPVILLTARDEAVDRIIGLEAGADDYLGKPFDPRELVLRINNILKRAANPQKPKIDQLIFGPFTFSLLKRELKRGATPIGLTGREQEIMMIFAANAGQTIARHELAGSGVDVGERTIDVQINRLRRKIEDDPGNPIWLQTVRGIGYKLCLDQGG